MEKMGSENMIMNQPNNAADSKECCINNVDIQRKLNHVMYSKRFCGICMERDHELMSIYKFLEINALIQVSPEDGYISIKNMLSDMFHETADILATSYICNYCLERAVQSYIFIENTKRSAKVIRNYITNFNYKISLLEDEIDSEENCNSKYLIVIEPSVKDDKDIEGMEKEDSKTLDKDIEEMEEEDSRSLEEDIEGMETDSRSLHTKNSDKETKVTTESTLILDGIKSTLQIKQNLQPNANVVLDKNEVSNQQNKKPNGAIKCKPQCSICKISFDYKVEYMQHVMDLHGPNYSCDECNENFDELKQFLLHHNEKHSQSLVCEVCCKSFVEQRKLLYHMKYAHTEPTPCDICKKMIKPVSMKSHLKSHSEKQIEEPPSKEPVPKSKVKKYICDICGQATAAKDLMQIHMYRHLKLKPFSCKVCGVAYSSKYQLNEHMISHNEEKWHHCNICDRKLRHRVDWKKHMMLHSGERPYVCEICGEGFVAVNRLNEHRRRHAGKTIQCPLCWRRFYTLTSLRYHIKRGHWKNKGQPFDYRLVEGLTEEHYHIFKDRRLAVVD